MDDWYTTGEVRWVPLSPMQAHRTRLQQLWVKNRLNSWGHVDGYDEEWRDVPTVNEQNKPNR